MTAAFFVGWSMQGKSRSQPPPPSEVAIQADLPSGVVVQVVPPSQGGCLATGGIPEYTILAASVAPAFAARGSLMRSCPSGFEYSDGGIFRPSTEMPEIV